MTIANNDAGQESNQGLEIHAERAGGNGWIRLSATLGGDTLAERRARISEQGRRESFLQEAVQRCQERGLVADSGLFRNLLDDALGLLTAGPEPVPGGGRAGYVALEDGPDAPCLAKRVEGGFDPITNFIARRVGCLVIDDDGVTRRRVVLEVISGNGGRRELELGESEYADANRLENALMGLGQCGFEVYRSPRELRNAIAGVSEGEVRTLTLTSAHGWAGPDRVAYLTNGGLVTAEGYRPYQDDDPVRLAPTEAPGPGRLGLARLESPELRRLAAHLTDDFARLHHRKLMLSLLGLPALAVLEPFARATQRPAFMLLGATGAGKSFLLRLLVRFFMAPGADNVGIPASWSSTANAVERGGYDFRGAIYGVDDFKREMVRDRDAIRIFQGNSEGIGRGRLHRDATPNPDRPIRGLLVSNGEALPDGAASVRARIVVLDVPGGAKRVELGARCLEECRHYSGVTAAFIAEVIRQGLGEAFARRADRFRADLLRGVEARQNADRIASNLALLGAASEAMVDFLCGLTGDGTLRGELGAYLGSDLPELRETLFASTEQEEVSTIFIEALTAQLAAGEVSIAPQRSSLYGRGSGVPGDWARLIGRHENNLVGISILKAVESVNRLLNSQGREPLRGRDVLEALLSDGYLRRRDGRPLSAEDPERTFQLRIPGPGNVVHMAFLEATALGFDDSPRG